MVNYKTNIWLVDSHTKSNRCYNDIDIFHQEHVLVFGTCFSVQSRVIRNRTDTIHLQYLRDFFYLFTAQAINNSRFSFMLFDKTDNIRFNIFSFCTYFIKQIRPVKRRLERIGVHHIQILQDVFLHFWRSRSCQSNHRNVAQLLYDGSQVSIFRTEIMSPFRDTVCFVYSHKRKRHASQELYVFFFSK
ncbi:hypothetical protein D3C86_1185590 [compost metagenome]